MDREEKLGKLLSYMLSRLHANAQYFLSSKKKI